MGNKSVMSVSTLGDLTALMNHNFQVADKRMSKLFRKNKSIAKRDAWMKWVNDRAVVYDQSIEVLKEEMDKNTKITMSLYIESKRSSIISFASYCVCSDNPVTREQFKRVFRLYAEYEEIIKDNDLQNGEVDIAIRIIREAYENHLRNGSFVEDVRGY